MKAFNGIMGLLMFTSLVFAYTMCETTKDYIAFIGGSLIAIFIALVIIQMNQKE